MAEYRGNAVSSTMKQAVANTRDSTSSVRVSWSLRRSRSTELHHQEPPPIFPSSQVLHFSHDTRHTQNSNPAIHPRKDTRVLIRYCLQL